MSASGSEYAKALSGTRVGALKRQPPSLFALSRSCTACLSPAPAHAQPQQQQQLQQQHVPISSHASSNKRPAGSHRAPQLQPCASVASVRLIACTSQCAPLLCSSSRTTTNNNNCVTIRTSPASPVPRCLAGQVRCRDVPPAPSGARPAARHPSPAAQSQAAAGCGDPAV